MPGQSEPVALGPELLLELQRGTGVPLHEQLEVTLRDHVRSGRLIPGTRLPSSRALAAQLGLSRGVVLEAYAQLTAEGYLVSSQGAQTRVAPVPAVERPPLPATTLEPPRALRLDPFTPDLAAFPRQQWGRSVRAAIREAPDARLGYGDPRGTVELRNQLMAYLGRVRGALPEPEHTLVCGGFVQAFAGLCRTLRARGVERIGVEAPGWGRHRLTAEGSGLEPVPIPVDEHGLVVSALAAGDCEVVVVTPAHHFPTGVVLGSERRAELLEWAEEEDGLIVEDDYDSELRYDRGAVGALQGLAPERVCHIGSLSKRLAPGLGLGWTLAPSWLSGALTYEQGVAAASPPAIAQLALADFLARGELDRHLRRMRLRYRERRQSLLQALAREIPSARASGVPAGLFTLVWLPEGASQEAVLHAAAKRGVEVEGLGGGGLILGFASQPEPAIARGVRVLAEALL
ncbi:MAG TPA: PLP-dependent aminotransferase family protein [Solirubrobacteraceae bacterium]|nr:PLP-dependent aminotransferase family protein [Solirubrobacteraceae bacterium]